MNPPLHMHLPLSANPAMLHHADLMRRRITDMFYGDLAPRDQLRAYHANMLDLAQAGCIFALDLTIDLAYVTEDDPILQTPGLVTLDPATLAARIRDMIAMRSRMLN